MRKILMLAGGLSLAMAIGAVAPSYAAPHDDAGAAIAGGVLGFMAGAAAAGGGYDYPPPRGDRFGGGGDGWRFHIRACLDRYGRRYDPRSDLVRWHGRVFPCDVGRRMPPPRPPHGGGHWHDGSSGSY